MYRSCNEVMTGLLQHSHTSYLIAHTHRDATRNTKKDADGTNMNSKALRFFRRSVPNNFCLSCRNSKHKGQKSLIHESCRIAHTWKKRAQSDAVTVVKWYIPERD